MQATRESRGYQERPDERSLAREVHQHASVWQLEVVGKRHEGVPLVARQIHYGTHRVLSQQLVHGPEVACEEICANRKLDVDVDCTSNMVIGAFLEGEFEMLADTSEVNNPENLEMPQTGF